MTTQFVFREREMPPRANQQAAGLLVLALGGHVCNLIRFRGTDGTRRSVGSLGPGLKHPLDGHCFGGVPRRKLQPPLGVFRHFKKNRASDTSKRSVLPGMDGAFGVGPDQIAPAGGA